mgnify:FL=1
MIKLFWNTQNLIKPKSSDPNRKDVFNYNWGNYHKVSSNNWIFLLLNKIKYEIVLDLNKIEKNDTLIIIDSSIEKKKDLYLKLRVLCSKLFLFHLGDETGMLDHSTAYNNCDYVWRAFCTNKYFNNNNLSCLPIGFKSGISHRKKERKFIWNFIGTPHKSSRHDLLHNFSEIKPFFSFKTKRFNDKNQMIEAEEMSEVLSSTIFSPCPNGFVHPETYRLYEALECGCIPIIENTYKYYDRLFPNNPFIKIDKWGEAKQILQAWDKDQIKKKKNECDLWWNKLKSDTQDFIKDKINS